MTTIRRKLINQFREEVTRQERKYFEKKMKKIKTKNRQKQRYLCFGLDRFLHSKK